jgi:cobalamin synthase
VLSFISRFPANEKFRFNTSRMDIYLPVTGLFPALLTLALYFAAQCITGLCNFAVAFAFSSPFGATTLKEKWRAALFFGGIQFQS